MQYLANPTRFLRLANAVLPYVWAITLGLFAIGLYGALVASPPDYQQGETVRIMFVHVPAAWMALMVYSVMALASAIAVIFRHPLADVAAKTAAPIGAVFCFLSLATGSLWGKPMWGAWWVWDARLTSMFVLMLLYIGYMAIWAAIDEPHRAAMIARIVALVGFINVPIVKYSVDWWNSLHQPASVFRMDGPTIDKSMLWPLLVMGLAYTFLFLALHLVSIRAEIAARKIRQIHIAEIGER
ncbi:heme ABC transporter permease [Aestuariivirga sp.]|uniref:heme ABC transporter permease n=1 Tax=Aestuariivirga sp. TaxID=2650926 RepID=UPI003593330E